MSHRRSGVLLVLMSLAFPLAAQQIASDPPQEWQADAKANKQAQKVAEKAAFAAMPKAPKRGGGDGVPGGDMSGPAAPPASADGEAPTGEPGTAPPGAVSERVTAASMLRSEMDFAAPLKDTLVLYRSREAVVFGRKESSDVVILPLDGSAVQVALGVQATLHDEAAGLRVEILTSNGVRVNYRYSSPSAGLLKVDVHAEGSVPRPGSTFDVERVYRLGAGKR